MSSLQEMTNDTAQPVRTQRNRGNVVLAERLFASGRLDGREWLGVAHAQARGNVVELTGDATVDG